MKDMEKIILNKIGSKLSGSLDVNNDVMIELVKSILVNNDYNTEIVDDNGQKIIIYSKLNKSISKY